MVCGETQGVHNSRGSTMTTKLVLTFRIEDRQRCVDRRFQTGALSYVSIALNCSPDDDDKSSRQGSSRLATARHGSPRLATARHGSSRLATARATRHGSKLSALLKPPHLGPVASVLSLHLPNMFSCIIKQGLSLHVHVGWTVAN